MADGIGQKVKSYAISAWGSTKGGASAGGGAFRAGLHTMNMGMPSAARSAAYGAGAGAAVGGIGGGMSDDGSVIGGALKGAALGGLGGGLLGAQAGMYRSGFENMPGGVMDSYASGYYKFHSATLGKMAARNQA